MIDALKKEVTGSSKTSRLWLQYCNSVNTLKQFIQAERPGNWNLYLNSIGSMINLFAATGHVHYAKSARLYLQEMCKLPEKFPLVYKQFSKKGLHSVHRSDRHWVGLSSDLVIEQVLMWSVKTRGGIAWGRGITDSVQTIYVNRMHQCSMIHQATGSVTQIRHDSGKTHVEVAKSRKNKRRKGLGNVDNMVPAEKSVWFSWWIIEKLINGPCSSFWIWNQLWLCWSSRLSHTKSSRWCQCWRSYRQKEKPDPNPQDFADQHLCWKCIDSYRHHDIT